MRCEEFENRLNEVLDQRLDPNQDEELCRHADECADCGDLLGIQNFVIRQLQSDHILQSDSPPVETRPLVSLGELSPAIRSWRDSAPAMFCLAVGVLVAVSTIPLFTRVAELDSGTNATRESISSLTNQRDMPLPATAKTTQQELARHEPIPGQALNNSLHFDVSVVSASFGTEWMELANASRWLAPVPQKLKPLSDSVGSAAAVLWRALDGESTSTYDEPQASAIGSDRTPVFI